MYSYKDSKSNIINILKSKTPIKNMDNIPSDNTFTYENGVKTWVSAIFVDIENSTKLFSSKDEKLARLMRAFCSEIICIMQNYSKYNQIGIRGDCVYAIYDVLDEDDLVKVFEVAFTVNTFMKMFNKIIKDYGYDFLNAGIGIGADEDLIIKAGRSGTGINDKIWIGKAVVDAANLSSKAARNNVEPIAMNSIFYNYVIEKLMARNSNYRQWIKGYNYNIYTRKYEFYHCNIIDKDFNTWIGGGMK